ncbi:MAG: alpha/beta fold hydrolase [Lysobacterales bacterium]
MRNSRWRPWRVIPAGLLLLLAGLLIYAWQPDLPVDGLKARWAPPPSQWMSVDGMQVHWRDEGRRDDPRPIVLIHGTSASLHTWDGWVAALIPKHRVIRMDLPGFGLTGPSPDGDYSLQAYVDHLSHFLDQVSLPHVVLVGNSLGGQIALATALEHPERVDGLILIDSAGYPFQPKSIPLGFRLARSDWTAPVARYLLPRSLVAASVRNTYGNPDLVSEELIDRYFELNLRDGNRDALIQRFRQTNYHEGSERIAELKLPTLIIWGGKDRLIPPENGERFHRDIQGSELRVFPDLGHVPQEEGPRVTVAAALRFLECLPCDQSPETTPKPAADPVPQ